LIEALKEIGVYSLERSQKDLEQLLDIIVEDPASTSNYKYILAIMLKKDIEGYDYNGVKLEEYTKEKIGKYLYRQGSPRGTDYTPTARLVEVDKTFVNKIMLWFTNSLKNQELTESQQNQLVEISNCLKENQKSIINNLKTITKNYFQANENGIITLKLIIDNKEKYIGEIPVFIELFKKEFSKKLHYSPTFKVHAISTKNPVCSVCMKQKDEVYGFVNTFNFYTVDKPGFVSGGFDRSAAWKNYPVCFECALLLEEGKQYLEKNLLFQFYGMKYYLVPNFLESKGDQKETLEIIEEYKRDIDSNIKINKKYGNLLTESENEILDILAQQENYLNYNFMFFEKVKSAFRILLLIEDILPSRIRKLFEAKNFVDNLTRQLSDSLNLKERKLSHFTFENIWCFFPKTRMLDLNKYFLEIVNNIFTNKKISYPFIMDYLIKKIQEDFRNGYSTLTSTIKAFQLLLYLNELDLLNNFKKEDSAKMKETNFDKFFSNNTKLDLDEKIDDFFNHFQDFFNTEAKKAVFLEGVLADFLLKIQYSERGSDPFRTRLQGLKMDENLIKRLLPEIQNKLEEYGKNYYKKLEEIISKYMIEAGNQWQITNNDISFYFILGMNLSSYFKKSTKGDKEND